jgi:hypothetical protein
MSTHHQTRKQTIFDALRIDSAVLKSSTRHGSVGRPAQQQPQMALQCVQDSLETNWVSLTIQILCIHVILHAVGLCGLFARHSRFGVEQHRPQGALLDLPLHILWISTRKITVIWVRPQSILQIPDFWSYCCSQEGGPKIEILQVVMPRNRAQNDS